VRSESAHRILIPPTPTGRSITTGRPRAPPSLPRPPPARRHFEYIPPTNLQRDDGGIPRRPTNRQIPFDHVYIVDPDTNKLSDSTHSLEELLATRQRRIIELVASTPKPIVRVTTRSEVEARYREMKRALKKGARVGEEPKEVQLTWGVAKADLEHKLRKARRDLEKGYRVAVVVTVKNGHRPSNRQELVAFADEISATLGEVGEEWKDREFTGRLMNLSFRKTELDDNDLKSR
jgi:translation initiation factor IF-3